MNRVYIKTGILSILLFIASYFLTDLILVPIKTHNYFGTSLQYSLKITLLMLTVSYLFSLSVGIWGNWKQYLFIAIPPIAAIQIVLMQINLVYGTLVSIIMLFLLCFDITRSNGLKDTFIKFRPSYILSLSASGLLFIFSVIGGVMVILSSPELPNINIGKSLAVVIEPQVKRLVNSELEKQTQKQMSLFNFGAIEGIDPAIKEMLDQAKNEAPVIPREYVNKMDLGGLIENQVNNFIVPYKDFLHPILAVLMFVLFQFYASIARVVFSFTVDPLFALAKKLKFLHVETVTVQKEELKF